jgi:hypothetical protein
MTLRDSDSPMRRMTVAIVTAVAMMAVAALVYIFLVSRETGAKFNGAAIVAAARAYTRDLQARNQPVPKSVTLEDLVALHFLKPGEIAAFGGLKGTIMLTADGRDPQTVLMRVHLPDGGDLLLLQDGSVKEAAH